MAASPLKARPPQQANLTPMIDVVFQLIIFFLLVAQFSQQRLIELELPSVANRQSERIVGESRAVINVVPRDQMEAMGGAYRIGALSFPDTFDGVEAMAETLRSIRARSPDVKVYIRADRVESYARVHPAMQAVTLAGIGQMELVTDAPGAGAQP